MSLIESYPTVNVFAVNGTQTVWNFAFTGGYISKSHVKAFYINGEGEKTLVTLTDAMFVGPYQINIAPALAGGGTLTVYRFTPRAVPLVDFVDGARISEASLDLVAKQSVFIAAETADAVAAGRQENFVSSRERQTIAAGQTVVSLASMEYNAGTDSLLVFADGIMFNDYVETDSGTITLTTPFSKSTQLTFVTGRLVTSGVDGGQISFVHEGVGTAARSVSVKLREHVSAADFSGYDPTGATSSVAALLAADAVARGLGLPLHITGTPLVDSTITLSAKTRWVFTGTGGRAEGDLPASYLKKAATLNGPALILAADGTTLDGGGIVGVSGNGGDGAQVIANGIVWSRAPYFYRMGRDGLRIGADTGPSNANGFRFEAMTSCGNGRHGVNIDDKPAGAPDANAGTLDTPFLHHNGSAGLYANNANLGNVILCPTLENNVYGLWWGPLANRNVVIGGDIEANSSAPVRNDAALPFGNKLMGISIEGIVTNSDRRFANFTPTVYGGTTAGTGTYSLQKGCYSFIDGVIHAQIELTWSAHTGTGPMRVDLPDITGQTVVLNFSNAPTYIPAVVVEDSMTLPAGSRLVALVKTDTVPPRLDFFTVSAGAASSALTLPAAGRLLVSATVPLIALT